jgi:hypothetical protein
MLLGIMCMVVAATQVDTPIGDAREHVLIAASSEAEKEFLPEAKLFAEAENFNPVTLDEIEAFLRTEKLKDVLGCTGVACYSELGGALDIGHVVRIVPNDANTRALLYLFSLFPMPERRKQKLVSHETAREALLRSVEHFRQERDALASVLRQVPCGFSWPELRRAIGEPHYEEILPDEGRYERERLYRRTMYRYFDIVIVVRKRQVRSIEESYARGPNWTSCDS